MTKLAEVNEQFKLKFLRQLSRCPQLMVNGCTFEMCEDFVRSNLGVSYLTDEEHEMIRLFVKYLNS